MKFNACDGLDFDGDYTATLATKNGIVFWKREPIDDMPTDVQFCKKRNRVRLNNAMACTSEDLACCLCYNEIDHDVNI